MWIERDISNLIRQSVDEAVQIIIGPRQCGKSSLLWHLGADFSEVTFDDLQARTLAEKDPKLFLSQYQLPLIIDEVQYAPNIFPEIKLKVDQAKRARLKSDTEQPFPILFRLTGSNQILMDKNVKESLVGRAGFYYLNTLSVAEITAKNPDIPIWDILFKGGWPELYVSSISTTKYLNDYIRNYIEKDIVLSAGISKQKEFNTVLKLLAARTAELLVYSDIAKDSGVKSITVKEWVSLLERSNLVYLLQPFANNLNKRLIKSPKLHFLDSGLTCRLQGWTEQIPMSTSPQIGHLFESLVLAEIIKTKQNYHCDWSVYHWRTKEGEEIDFVIQNTKGELVALDAKLGVHGVQPQNLPPSFSKHHPEIKTFYLISAGGEQKQLSNDCQQVPITKLKELLLTV